MAFLLSTNSNSNFSLWGLRFFSPSYFSHNFVPTNWTTLTRHFFLPSWLIPPRFCLRNNFIHLSSPLLNVHSSIKLSLILVSFQIWKFSLPPVIFKSNWSFMFIVFTMYYILIMLQSLDYNYYNLNLCSTKYILFMFVFPKHFTVYLIHRCLITVK